MRNHRILLVVVAATTAVCAAMFSPWVVRSAPAGSVASPSFAVGDLDTAEPVQGHPVSAGRKIVVGALATGSGFAMNPHRRPPPSAATPRFADRARSAQIGTGGRTFTVLPAGFAVDSNRRLSRSFEVVLPLRGHTRDAQLSIAVTGTASSVAPAAAWTVVRVNGVTSTDMRRDRAGRFVQVVDVPVTGARELRLRVELHLAVNGSQASLTVVTVRAVIS